MKDILNPRQRIQAHWSYRYWNALRSCQWNMFVG